MNMLTVFDPFDRTQVGEVPLRSEEEVEQALFRADALYRNRREWLPAHQRAAILERASQLMQTRFDELAMQIALEGGKPLVDARVEVTRAIDGVKLCAKELLYHRGEEVPMDLTPSGAGRMAFTTREPIGPVVAISAFNHPLNLIVHQVAPAIAAGCPVIVKPSEETPLSAQSFVQILNEAGLPEHWCQLMVCEIPLAEKLATDRRVGFLTFIGSARVGWMLRSKLAPGTRCALEHGGAAPVIVDESADLEAMLPLLVKGGFYHAGQVCVSVQRVFAPRAMATDLARRLGEAASKLVVGHAIKEDVDVGPLIRPAEVNRVEKWIEDAKMAGAKVVAGEKK